VELQSAAQISQFDTQQRHMGSFERFYELCGPGQKILRIASAQDFKSKRDS
jgi:hypothetical protein